MLISLLVADLERQFRLRGLERRVSWVSFIQNLLHPRFLPNVLIRISHSAKLAGIPGLPALCSYLNIVLFGLEVAPRCQIGPGLFLPHTSGTVIGAWRLGKNVTVFQNVTLGAKEIDMGFDPAIRPNVGDGVTLGSGSRILGGVSVGDNVAIGANAVVLTSIPPNSVAVGIPARVVSQRTPNESPDSRAPMQESHRP